MKDRHVLGGMLGCMLAACASNPAPTVPPNTANDTGTTTVALVLLNSQNVDEHIVAKGNRHSLSPHEKNALRYACGARSGWVEPPRGPGGEERAIPPGVIGMVLQLASSLVNDLVDRGIDRVSRALAKELEKYTAAYEAGVTFNFYGNADGGDASAVPVVRYPCYRFTRATWNPDNKEWDSQLDVIGQFAFNELDDGTVLPETMTRILRVYYADPVVASEIVSVRRNGTSEQSRPVALSLTLDLTSNWWTSEESGSLEVFQDSRVFVQKFDFLAKENSRSPPHLTQLAIIDNPSYDASTPEKGPPKIYDPDQGWISASGAMPRTTTAPWIDAHRRIGMVDLKITAAEVGQPDAGLKKLAALLEANKEVLAETAKTKFGAAIGELLK